VSHDTQEIFSQNFSTANSEPLTQKKTDRESLGHRSLLPGGTSGIAMLASTAIIVFPTLSRTSHFLSENSDRETRDQRNR
jgi:hypothetical protein